MTFNVVGNKLNAILNQRSQDMLTANNWNVVQYATLVIMMAEVSGLEPGEFVHVISDEHIYDRHIPICEDLFTREQYDAPKLVLKRKVTDFYDFKVDDFELVDYKYTPLGKKIEVAI
jgi:thymidylate synthase